MSSNPGSIGRYQVLSELGAGAMGVVYLAQDPLLKRKVAIKCMKERGDEHSSVLERFRREAETSSRLNHPNVITVYDVGEDPEAGPFLAMEYVEGSSLAGLIARGALTREAGLEVLIQVAMGLTAAGNEGIIHRDVKPENILVSKEGRAKLMDFGIARGEGSRLTTTGMVVGTPSYTAPELLLGKEACFATDLYAFAVTAFELFTGGELPYTGDSLGVTLYRIVHEPPTLPDAIEPALAHVFERALAKDPGQRYPDLGTFLTALADGLGMLLPALPGAASLHAHGGAHPSTPRRPSQEDLRTAAVAAPRPAAKESGSGEAVRHISAPPQDLLKHREAPSERPLPPRPLPSPAIGLKTGGTSPSAAGSGWDLGQSVKALFMAAVVVVAAFYAWQAWTSTQTRSVAIHALPRGLEGAYVEVDNVVAGAAGVEIPIRPGERKKVTVRAPGYRDQTQVITHGDASVEVPMTLAQGHIRILSEPRIVNVYIDGQPVGQTPKWAYEIGSREVTLKLVSSNKGYEVWERRVSALRPPPDPIRLVAK